MLDMHATPEVFSERRTAYDTVSVLYEEAEGAEGLGRDVHGVLATPQLRSAGVECVLIEPVDFALLRHPYAKEGILLLTDVAIVF